MGEGSTNLNLCGLQQKKWHTSITNTASQRGKIHNTSRHAQQESLLGNGIPVDHGGFNQLLR